MLIEYLKILLPVAVIFFAFLPPTALLLFAHRLRMQRKTPLTKDLLRPPGHSLRLVYDELREKIDMYLVMTIILPVTGLSAYLLWDQSKSEPIVTAVAISLAILFWELLLLWLMWKSVRKAHQIRVGLDGEMAVAEELNLLMLEGCRVFHDVPIEYGNIDHVVVSPSGVFAIETKTVTKLPEKGMNAKVSVDSKSNVIHFPNFDFKINLDQVETQVRCLTDFLSESTGDQIQVKPIIVIPGWYVERTFGQQKVRVINPALARQYLCTSTKKLNNEQIQRIVFQLNRICRDVEPSLKHKQETLS
ncbi:Nuclease-related domain protein [Bremerella volcania]|uniref:Nuclease-related domain protein n=1 Tax=Bremerella volcania TaxID=2527984 RepID=A0A518C6U4_9BACT|nr:nuclease-related domain-containing protein [Bremerella volcania]QDU74940.1 Nuclease-related domain protein [Bremerella volcania]